MVWHMHKVRTCGGTVFLAELLVEPRARGAPDLGGSLLGMVKGVHTMFYCSQAEELRAWLKEKIGFSGVDVGGGWTIFELPEADMGVHPLDHAESPPSGTADISFYCDDIAATVAELKARGVEFAGEVKDAGFGHTAHMKAPGGFEIMLYQPKYSKG